MGCEFSVVVVSTQNRGRLLSLAHLRPHINSLAQPLPAAPLLVKTLFFCQHNIQMMMMMISSMWDANCFKKNGSVHLKCSVRKCVTGEGNQHNSSVAKK